MICFKKVRNDGVDFGVCSGFETDLGVRTKGPLCGPHAYMALSM